MIFVPFNIYNYKNEEFATIKDDGDIMYYTEPQYHGDPVNPCNGILCFRNYGWSLLDDIKNCGFSKSSLILYYSYYYMYLGKQQILIYAIK